MTHIFWNFSLGFLMNLTQINLPSWRLNSLLRAIFCMVHNAVNDTVIQIIISIRSFNEVVIAGIFLTNFAFAKVICFSASLILSRTASESKTSWTWLFRRDIIFKHFQGEIKFRQLSLVVSFFGHPVVNIDVTSELELSRCHCWGWTVQLKTLTSCIIRIS